METMLLRALIVMPVAVLLPLGLPRLPRASRRALITGAIVVAALAVGWRHWQTWVIAGCAVTAGSVPVPDRNRPWRVLVALVIALVVTVLVTDARGAVDTLQRLASDWRVTTVLAGGAACVFVGGAVIDAILHPFSERVGQRPQAAGLEHAGRAIGWIERALVYGFVLVGMPNAAALVIAVKSIARFPYFNEVRFAEYFLIGSLLSLSVAFGMAIAVRAIIGLNPVGPI